MTVSPASLSKSNSGAASPSATKKGSSLRRAIGVVRVSRVGDRDGERFVSPSEQRDRIEAACARDGLTLAEVVDELDVSGGAPLDRRPGLSRALDLIEAGEAEVLVVAYFDRLFRSLAVQAEVVERVERAGGAILAVDTGALTGTSAGSWLSGTMLGAVSEYARRVTAERTQDAKRRAVARGVAPFPNLPPGYRRAADAKLEVDPKPAKAVAEAFRLRASGATVMDVREHLRRNGIARSFHGTMSLLASRVVLGELHFGDLVNVDSHPAIVDAETWGRVQRMSVSRGRRAKSERLLARLGVLRCGTCGSRMVVGTANNSGYYLYRCPPNGDCPRRVTISADIAEQAVVAAVRAALADVTGSASGAEGVQDAERDLERSEHDLDAAVAAFSGLEDVTATRERLHALRDARDAARDRLDDLRAAAAPTITITAGEDWDMLSLDAKRAIIRVVVESATVAPGRRADRITVETRGQ